MERVGLAIWLAAMAFLITWEIDSHDDRLDALDRRVTALEAGSGE